MTINIREYCIRCCICEDLYPELFRLDEKEDRMTVLHDIIPEKLEEKAAAAAKDCAIAAIQIIK